MRLAFGFWAGLVLIGSVASAGAEDTSMCGRKADMVDLILHMQSEALEKVWADSKLFVYRDRNDGTQWVVSMPKTTVHPAAACRRKAGNKVEAGLLCSAGEKACESFQVQAAERMDKVEASASE
jgi:hypothetical protein